MNKNWLWLLWGLLYIVCAGLGFIPEPSTSIQVACIFVSAVFFLPPYQLLRHGEWKWVMMLSLASLLLTLVTLIANILSYGMDTTSGDLLHTFLGLVSVPMFSSQFWVLGLFGWACLLMLALRERKRG